MKFDLFYQLPTAMTQNVGRRYRELIDECVEADRLGFNTVWLAEVHFAQRFSSMPTPMLLLAAIAERTTRLRLGLAVNLIPLHQPIRIAEETATLDVLSGGRVEFGAGRGAFTLNYRGYEVNMETSRTRFVEGLDFIQRAWSQDRMTFHGNHFNVDSIEVIPKPIQQPHPPIRLAANSPDTFAFAGVHAYPIFSASPVNPIPMLAERLEIYNSALKRSGKQLPDDWHASSMFVFVGRDRASVRAMIEPSLRNYFNSASETAEPESTAPAHQAELKRVLDRLRSIQYETVYSTMGIFGEPEYCIDRIAELRERFNFSRLVCWFEVGGLSGHRNVLDSMRLFAEKVIPRFR